MDIERSESPFGIERAYRAQDSVASPEGGPDPEAPERRAGAALRTFAAEPGESCAPVVDPPFGVHYPRLPPFPAGPP